MHKFLIPLILLLPPFICVGADNYSVGDTLYVWSSEGLHLKVSPSDESATLQLVNGGELVIVREKTSRVHNAALLGGKNHANFDSSSQVSIEGYWAPCRIQW